MASIHNTYHQRMCDLFELKRFFEGEEIHPQVARLWKIGAIARDVLAETDIAKLEDCVVDSTVGRDISNKSGKKREVKAKSLSHNNTTRVFNFSNREINAKDSDFIIRVYNDTADEAVDCDVPLSYLKSLQTESGIGFSWSSRNGYNRLNQFIVRRFSLSEPTRELTLS